MEITHSSIMISMPQYRRDNAQPPIYGNAHSAAVNSSAAHCTAQRMHSRLQARQVALFTQTNQNAGSMHITARRSDYKCRRESVSAADPPPSAVHARGARDISCGPTIRCNEQPSDFDALRNRLAEEQLPIARSVSASALPRDIVFLSRKPAAAGVAVALDSVYTGTTRDRSCVILGRNGIGMPEHGDDVRLLADRLISRQKLQCRRHQRPPRRHGPPCTDRPCTDATHHTQKLLRKIKQYEASLSQRGIVV